MKMNPKTILRCAFVICLLLVLTIGSSRLRADSGTCGGVTITVPFTDIAGNPFFCQIAEAFFSGLTNGTTPTTYNPGDPVLRDQMAAFVTRTLDQSLRRGSRRAALKQFWTPTSEGLALTTVGISPNEVESDGADLWVANFTSSTVARVRASDGKLLETWTGAPSAVGLVAAKGLIFVTGFTNPGQLFQIDPTQPQGAVTILPIALGASSYGVTFDGARVWTANRGIPGPGSVSIVTLNPLGVTTLTAGFMNPNGILYDGSNTWVTDTGNNSGRLFKLDSLGGIIQTVIVGDIPGFPVFDGTNIWVPSDSMNTMTVVRASTGAVVNTLSGNGLNGPLIAAFDGERILVTNSNGNSVSLWKATDMSPLGSVATGANTFPLGACSDGLNFWITLNGTSKLVRF